MSHPVNLQATLRGTSPFVVRSGVASRLRCLAVAVTMGLGTSLAWAQTEEYANVNRLLRSGQLAEALAKADQYLVGKARDPQMRFLKGVILTESGKTQDAIATFSKLTEDFPELPEPYNNLAVLYASQSQFDKARAALEMAIRTNPSYATAHENLGDVYAKLASQAYSKALQLDGTNPAVAPKLSLIRNLFAADTRSGAAASVAAAPASAPVAAKPASPAPVAAVTKPASPAAAMAAPAAPAVAPDAQREVEAAVRTWAGAWSSKDMNGYLGAYDGSFVPPGGQARKAWESDRRARIEPRTRIGVDVSDLVVTVNADKATARFRQDYTSDTLNVTSRKTLDLVKSGNRWLIVRESTGS
ncbi:tetratricopeptide repeat protein [Hydrogenophaga sp.]|uniref:nuclear transport factor 2 family protein n=1 Tax=Hydrogenophaga sp. TaxID=1904254 RepID=UPI00351FDACE